jgi:phosphate transport system substrate-binding protein
MSNNENNKTAMHRLNPKFKKQILSLKEIAKSEFDIQISTDKMIQDKTYRNIVLDELNELNSEALSGYIQLLKRTPIYIKSVAEPFSLDALPAMNIESNIQKNREQPNIKKQDPPSKNSRRTLLLILLLLLISFYTLWYKGYLSMPLFINNLITPTSQITAQESHATSIIPLEAPINTAKIKEIPTPILPSNETEISFRLHGSNTVGEDLAPALLEAYLKSIDVNKMKWVQGNHNVERNLQYIKDNKVYRIELHAHGSSTAFKDLLAEKTDMGMASRIIKEKEVQQLLPLYGDLTHQGQENIIGLDGLAIIVHRDNPLNSLTTETLAKIFAGEITNWRAIGGSDMPIHIYARDNNSGTWDTFKTLVLKTFNKKLISSANRFESSNALSDQVSNDPLAIGFIGLPYINNSKAIAIAASSDSSPIYPTRFTVSTEDYPLSRRLYMYVPSLAKDVVQSFIHFTLSHEGQEVVEKIGLISQNIKLETIHTIKNAPPTYNEYTKIAQRLSVNFRFKSGSNELDNKGKRDLIRLIDFMLTQQGRRIVLMGFSDSLGDPQLNIKLSTQRALVLEQALTARGLDVVAVKGFGELLPVASNRNTLGRSKNRRVEVWVY